VLAVVAVEVRHHGACTLTIGHMAALAGVGRSTVKRALREAVALGFVCVEERSCRHGATCRTGSRCSTRLGSHIEAGVI